MTIYQPCILAADLKSDLKIVSQHRPSTPPMIVITVPPRPIICILTVLCYLHSTLGWCPIFSAKFLIRPLILLIRPTSRSFGHRVFSCRPGFGGRSSFWLFGEWTGGGVGAHIFVGRYPSHFKTLAQRHLSRIRVAFPQVVRCTRILSMLMIYFFFYRLNFFFYSQKLYRSSFQNQF